MEQIRGVVWGVRCLLLTILIGFTVYLLMDRAGMMEEFNSNLSAPEATIGFGASQSGLEMVTVVNATFMKDPEGSSEIQVYKGAMKKSAVDRMTILKEEQFEISEDEIVVAALGTYAQSVGANAVLINNTFNLYRTKMKGE